MESPLQNLNPQQRMFVLEYIKDFKASAAAVRVGFHPDVGPRLLADVAVQAGITEAMEERIERTKIDAEWVLHQLGRMYDADMADLFDPATNTLLPVHQWPEIWRKMTTSVKVTELFEGSGIDRCLIGYSKDIKIMDRLRVIEMLGKHVDVRAFSERVEVTTDQELTERLLAGRRRAREMRKKTAIDFM